MSWTNGVEGGFYLPPWWLEEYRVSAACLYRWVRFSYMLHRPVVPGPMVHPDFGRSVNPISTRGDRLCPLNYYWHTRIFRPSDSPGMSWLICMYVWTSTLNWNWPKWDVWIFLHCNCAIKCQVSLMAKLFFCILDALDANLCIYYKAI